MGGEPDKVRWRGVRPVEGISGVWPARNSVRVQTQATMNGLGFVDVYEVPENKKCFISTAALSSMMESANKTWVNFLLEDDEAALQLFVVYHLYVGIGTKFNFANFMPAVEAPAGWKYRVGTGHADAEGRAFLFGWLEDA